MFHVEQPRMKQLIVFFLGLILLSCNKPDPNPELKDPIYTDLMASATALTQQLENEKKTLEENKKALLEVVPQSGQNKYAEKRVRDSNDRISRLEQEKQYLELKIEAHKKTARRSYLQAFKKGQEWPNPDDWNTYQMEKRLHSAKKSWSVKDRINEFSEKENKKGPESSSKGH